MKRTSAAIRAVMSLSTSALVLAAACATTTPPAPGGDRHGEFVSVGPRAVKTWVVYPEVSKPAMAVVVIHENRGLTDWVRTVADRLAGLGYVALAPDLLSGTGPGGGGTASYADSDAARDAIYQLSEYQVIADLGAVAAYAKALPATSERLVVAGFCWGGSQTWTALEHIEGIDAGFVFYGTGPASAGEAGAIESPVFGFYGGDDARVSSTIDGTAAVMATRNLVYEPVVYDGAGHAFMRNGETASPGEANREAMEKAWKRWTTLLARLASQ